MRFAGKSFFGTFIWPQWLALVDLKKPFCIILQIQTTFKSFGTDMPQNLSQKMIIQNKQRPVCIPFSAMMCYIRSLLAVE
jgi:hypothetical protein